MQYALDRARTQNLRYSSVLFAKRASPVKVIWQRIGSKIRITWTDTFCPIVSILHPDVPHVHFSWGNSSHMNCTQVFPLLKWHHSYLRDESLLVRLSGKCVTTSGLQEQPLIFLICIAFRS